MSTKIFSTRPGAAARVARDWRVVMVPDSNNTLDVLGLYDGICSHSFDQHEPFVAIGGSSSVKAQVGRLETGLSQDIPLSDATNTFGIYFIRLEPEEEGSL